MKIALVSFGHVDVVLPLVKNLKNRDVEVDLILCFALNRKSESILDFADKKINTGFLSKEMTEEILPEGIKKYLIDISSVKFFIFHNLKLRSFKNFLLSLTLVKKLKTYDIIHFNGTNGALPLLIFLLRKKKLVFTIHDIKAHSGEKTRFNFAEKLNDYIINSKYLLVNQNLSDYNYLRNKYPQFISKFHFIPFGVLDIYREYNTATTKAQSCDLLFFGRISPYKGIEYLIEALELLRVKGVKTRTIIAGNGKIYFNVQNFDCLNIILLNKYITNEELAGLINGSKIVVCPYTDATQSGVVMTAFAFQKPVIATSVGGFKDVINNNYNGFLVPPKDSNALAEAIYSLLKDEEKLTKMRKNIIEFEKNSDIFSWENISQKYFRMYRDMLVQFKKE